MDDIINDDHAVCNGKFVEQVVFVVYTHVFRFCWPEAI